MHYKTIIEQCVQMCLHCLYAVHLFSLFVSLIPNGLRKLFYPQLPETGSSCEHCTDDLQFFVRYAKSQLKHAGDYMDLPVLILDMKCNMLYLIHHL